MCTGLLAAAAVSCARSLSELIPLAIEAVRLSFRIGTCVGNARAALEHSSDAHSSWSTIVANTSEQEARDAIDAFSATLDLPQACRPYISAVSTMAVTVSGPPSLTRRLFEQSDALTQRHRVAIPIFAPYHAKHVFHEGDIGRILDLQSVDLLTQFRPQGLVHSAATGKCYQAATAFELMRSMIREILQEPVRWDLLLDEVVSQITELPPNPCHLHALGVTNVINSLVAALKAGGQTYMTVKDHSAWMTRVERNTGRPQNDKIAIVGMAGRFPDAANHDALWDLLMKGLDVHREVPQDRFDAHAHCDATGKAKNKSHTPYGCFITEPGLFDPRFFNMSPREAAQTDPMGRLALVTAYEALEMSGYVPNRTPSSKLHRIGTFYGQTSDDWREINAAENIDTYFITGGVRAFAPGRINYYFKFSGPSFSIDTACSSSLAAIQLACTSLWAGDCDTACAGGLNVLTNPDIFAGLSKGQFLSKTGSCKTYDDDADGYCRGDGCGSVILKRYEDAIADKDNILGCILSAGTNHSAQAVSITHPHAGAQQFLYKKVLADANVDAHDVSYVEMHGTGTQAGDSIEMTSVTNVFAPPNRWRRPDQPLHLGAVKANIGHGEAASGISSLIKILMMMRENQIPPNVGIKGVLNKSFPPDLAQRNIHIPTKATPYPRSGSDKRKIFLNNFSAAGGNTALVLEDGPIREHTLLEDPRGHHVITVTARAISSLKRNIDALIAQFRQQPSTGVSSLSYSLTARRVQHNYRVAFSATDMPSVLEGLEASIKDSYSPISSSATTPVAFSFTGQGSHYTGLGLKLYQDSRSFHEDIDWLNSVVEIQGLPSILPVVQGQDVAELCPVVTQLGITCTQVALARLWMSWGVSPSAVIGHSLGEYAALHIAGVLSASEMVRLVGARAKLLVANCSEFSHGMLAVKGRAEAIIAILGSNMTEIACKNGPEDVVLCGTVEILTSAQAELRQQGLKSTMLAVPFAFHSAQVDVILEQFERVASTVVFNKPTLPLLSPLLGSVVDAAGLVGAEYLVRHARGTVDFHGALLAGQEAQTVNEKTAWLEIGPHPVCTGMIRATLPCASVTAASLRRAEDPWKTISASVCSLYLAGVPVNFDEYHRDFNESQELLDLPTYAFDNKKYWLDYHNNWTLTKGEAAPVPAAATEPLNKPKPSKPWTTSCQQLVKEDIQANSGTVIFQTDLADPQLAICVTGHLVNDNPLCPSSLYADQALTVADYLLKRLHPEAEGTGLNVCSMEVPKPLIAKAPAPAEGQHMQIEGHADLEAGHVKVRFRSVTPEGKGLVEHAHCLVKFERTEDWTRDWNMLSYMVQTQVDMLRQRLSTGSAHQVLRGMAYKLFKNFVNYAPPFRGMSEVVFDDKEPQGTATVNFQASEKDGHFFCAPYWIDSLAHLSGFICNGTDLIDSDQFLYISHGWASMRFSRPFSADETYRSYVRMQSCPGNVRIGDVYIFHGEEIVGVVGGLKFQQIPRKVMNMMLPPPKGSAPSAVPTATAAAAASTLAPRPAAPARVPAAIVATRAAKLPRSTPIKVQHVSLLAKVMKIIAEETDVDMAELVDEAAFENLGVDSLLSLTISARLREDLDMDVPSDLFQDHPTIGAMKKWFSQFDGSAAMADDASSASTDDSARDTPASDLSSTPPSSPFSVSSVDGKDDYPSKPMVAPGPSIARQIISEEMGVDVSELTDKAELASMGMDSLMSLTVLGALRERTGMELSADFLNENCTIEEIEQSMGLRPKPTARPIAAPRSASAEPKLGLVNAKLRQPRVDVSGCPRATSVLMQGSLRTSTKKLFLLPDGSGSATSYAQISKISPDLAVFALNCPFMKRPLEFTVGIEGIAQLYVQEIQRRQPSGPYYLGGWSAGGVIAYEVTCQLMASGQRIERLLLIDAPCPVDLEPLPPRLHHFFAEIGLLGDGPDSIPDWLLPHFSASIQALSDYVPQPMPTGAAPKTLAIWAREGVCGKPGDRRPPPQGGGDDPAPMRWLLENRTDFGDNGWGQLLGDAMTFEQMDGNHFTMMSDVKLVSRVFLISSFSKFRTDPRASGHRTRSSHPRGPQFVIWPVSRYFSLQECQNAVGGPRPASARPHQRLGQDRLIEGPDAMVFLRWMWHTGRVAGVGDAFHGLRAQGLSVILEAATCND